MSFRRFGATVVAGCLVACNHGPGSAPSGSSGTSQTAEAPATPASGSAPTASGAAPPASAEPIAAKGPKGPMNVVLLSIDSLRADQPWTGYAKPVAPNLTAFAAESVLYTHAYSVSSYTAKSVGAFLTGRYPSSLYRSGWFFTDYAKSNTFLAEVLHEHGVRTIGVQAHKYFARGKQLDQGFDVWELVPNITFDATTDKNVTSDKMTDLGIKLLGDPANTGKPFFAWMHYLDPHDEYKAHAESPDFGKGNRGRYDQEVFFTDLHVGRLLDFLKKQPFWENTVVIVTADHGEAFGEHGAYKHAFWLWEVLTRVPLLVHAPGLAPKRIDEKRSHVDLAPTILDLAGVKDVPTSFVGRSLVPEIYGLEKPADRDPIVLELPEDNTNPDVRAIIQGDLKLITYDGGRRELFDLKTDPEELHDLSKAEPGKLGNMKELEATTRAKIPSVTPYGGMKLRSGKMATGPMGP